MTSQSGEQTIVIYILPNNSRSKSNQTKKLGQLLIEYNMTNIFLEKSNTKCGGETSPRPFPGKIKTEDISESIVLSFMQFVFIVC